MKQVATTICLVLAVSGCGFDDRVPSARLKCNGDSDCPGGGRCLATLIPVDAGGTVSEPLP